jgi:hypothetical protein
MTRTATKQKTRPYILLDREERLRVLENVRGMWKNRKPDPIKELAKIRKEWDRKLP